MTGVCALVFALASTAFGQGVTTAAVSGFVTDKDGKGVAGATVTLVHEPTGTKASTTTNAAGGYNLPGLRVGGPYTATVSGNGFQTVTQNEIDLGAGVTQDLPFKVSSDVVKLEAFNVSEARDLTFSSEKTGNATVLTATQIEVVPVVRQDVQELANLDPRINIVQNTSTGEFQMSAQGQNFRYNSFLIDGLESNDPFGLNGNGFSSQRSPVPLQALENFSVNFSPYDTRFSGFTGALINAVTKSGTNSFHGSADYRYSDQRFRGKNPITDAREAFRDRSYTLTATGPIVKDKLFFSLVYDDYRRVAAPPNQIFQPTDAAQIASIVAKLKTFGYDPGNFTAVNTSYQKTYLAKLDWNISDKHHAKVSFRRTDSSVPQFANYNLTFTTSFSNYWYQAPRLTDNYVAQLDSQWTPNLHTEATVAYIKYDGSPVNNGTPFPEVNVGGITGFKTDTGATITSGAVLFGTEFSRQLNFITTKDKLAKFYADYTWGNHVFLVGVDGDKLEYNNQFVQAYNGTYTFSNVANFLAGTPASSYQDAKLFPGYTLDSAFAAWTADNYGAIIQDTFRPNPRLTLMGGIRLTYPHVPTPPIAAAGFSTANFGYNGRAIRDNTTTNNGNYTVAPRFSFNYDIPAERKTAVRGGFGLFSGTNPAVWLSNAYSNAGAIGRVSNATGIVFSADPRNQPIPAGSPPAPVINVTDPKFKPPTYWKANIGFDHQLPFLGLIFTFEASYNRVEKAPFVASINLKPNASTGGPATMPDGRIRYAGNIYPGYNTGVAGVPTGFTTSGSAALVNNTAFNNVLYLTDTNKGEGRDVTASFRRPMRNGWSAELSWTHLHATEVSPFTSSVAASNFSGRAYANPNEEVASTANYDLPDKVVLRVTRQFDFFKNKNARTNIGLTYRAQTGHPYSYVFRGDANGDGLTGNDLFYMPSGPSDPLVAWNSTTERDNFFAFAAGTGLTKYAGQIVPRNIEYSAWQKTLDLHFSQEIPVYGNAKFEIFADCTNFGNLLSKSLGIVEGIDFPYSRRIVGNSVNASGQYLYFFNSSTLDAVPKFQDLSRWQLQIGGRLRF